MFFPQCLARKIGILTSIALFFSQTNSLMAAGCYSRTLGGENQDYSYNSRTSAPQEESSQEQKPIVQEAPLPQEYSYNESNEYRPCEEVPFCVPDRYPRSVKPNKTALILG